MFTKKGGEKIIEESVFIVYKIRSKVTIKFIDIIH